MRPRLPFRLVLALLLFGTACARRAPEPAAAPQLDTAPAPAEAMESEEVADLDALEHELSLNEQRLNQHLAKRTRASAIALREEQGRSDQKSEKPKGSSATGGAFAEPPPPAAAPRPARKRAEERLADDDAGAAPAAEAPASNAEPESSAESACELVCRAFGSMQRSAERICAITGEDDERCRRARSRVADASARISGARCACSNDE